MLLDLSHADCWSVRCCCIFRFDAASLCLGLLFAYAFNADSCGVQFTNAISIFAFSYSTNIGLPVPFLPDVSTIYSHHEFCCCVVDLLCVSKWVNSSANIGFAIGLLCHCHCTCIYQNKVSRLSLRHTVWDWVFRWFFSYVFQMLPIRKSREKEINGII